MKKGKILTLALLPLFILTMLPSNYTFNSRGHSMNPSIQEGDISICTEADKFQEGDIVVFNGISQGNPYILIQHRIVEKNKTHLVTKGDNNDYMDEPIKRRDVICKTRTVIPTGKIT